MFRWRLCGWRCGSSTAVLPGLDDDSEGPRNSFNAKNHHSVETEKRERASSNLLSLMGLDPTDSTAISSQYSICERRCTHLDGLSNLCRELLSNIIVYLNPEEAIKIRLLNRRIFLYQIITSRYTLYRSLAPRIKTGFECLHISSISAACLIPFIPQIVCLLSKESRTKFYSKIRLRSAPDYFISNIEGELDEIDSLKNLILSALRFYRKNNVQVFWQLLNAIIKGQSNSQLATLMFSFGFRMEETIYYISGFKLHNLAKYLLNQFPLLFDVNLIYSGCLSCIDDDYVYFFKLLVKEFMRFKLDCRKLSALLRKAVKLKRLSIARLLLETFPFEYISNAQSLFLAVNAKDAEMTELLLKYRGNIDFNLKSPSNGNLMEIAAKADFVEGIVMLHSVAASNINFFQSPSPLNVAIQNNSHAAILKIVEIVTGSGKSSKKLDQIYDNNDITRFIGNALKKRDPASLEIILKNLKSHRIKDFGRNLCVVDEGSDVNNYTIIHLCIKLEYEEGLDVLVEHFGVEALEMTDQHGRTPFLSAVVSGNVYLISKIAQMNPLSVHMVDSKGNNALHLALCLYHSKSFLKLILDLDLNVHTKNALGVTPLDLMFHMSGRIDSEPIYELYDSIIASIEHNS